jgi:hypothetical protein
MFTTFSMLQKHVTKERIGFDATTISFSTMSVVNGIALLFGIAYWSRHKFHANLFWIGFFGSFIDSIGVVALSEAFSCGPAGPISAVVGLCSLVMVLVEAIKHWKMLSTMEIIAFILGMYGTIVLSVPEWCETWCFCLCVKNK